MDDPSDADSPPPPPSMPEGVTIERTHGGASVIRLAFDGDAERDAERALPPPEACAERLTHPTTSAPVFVIGTAHISAASADETRRLILAAEPDVVVLELDPRRLAHLVEDAQHPFPAARAARKVATHLDALRVVLSGDLVNVAGGLGYAAAGAVLGSQPGAEFLAAVDAAAEVGAAVVLGDLDARTTAARTWERIRARGKLRGRENARRRAAGEPSIEEEEAEATRAARSIDESGARGRGGANDAPSSSSSSSLASASARPTMLYPDGERRPAPAPTPRHVRELLAKAGCDVDAAVASAWQLALFADPRPEDVATARRCGAKVVELARSRAFLEEHAPWGGAAGGRVSGAASSRGATYDASWAVEQSVKRDRDLVLAHSLQRQDRAKKIVGVVGAGHVAGIKTLWDDAPSRASRAAYDECLAKTPRECTEVGAGSWWVEYAPYAGACGAGAALAGLAGLGGTKRGPPAAAAEAAKPGVAAASGFYAALGRAARLAAGVSVGAAFAGTFLATHALVNFGALATKLERAAREAERLGLVEPRKNQLTSEKWWSETEDEFGNARRAVSIRAKNAVRAYGDGEHPRGRMLYR